jgi:hypothetical protein
MTVPHGDKPFQIYRWYGAGPAMHKASWIGEADTQEDAEQFVRDIYTDHLNPPKPPWGIIEPAYDRIDIVDQARRQVVSSFTISSVGRT